MADSERESKLKLYSMGIVIEDKERDSDQIKVYPVEEMPYVDGKVKDYKKEFKVSGPDAKGIERSSKVEGNAEIIAKWIPYGNSNRITSPDVIKNETVVLYRYADTDDYYWTTIFREPSLRRLETACFMYGDLPSGIKDYDKESSYWFQVSTHDKHIQVHTSKTDKELYEYDILLDTAQGTLTIKDDIGNIIYLDSKIPQIKLTNSDGSFIDINASNIEINAPSTVTVNAANFIVNAISQINNTLTVQQLTTLQGGIAVSGGIGGGSTTGTFDGSLSISDKLNVGSNVSTGANVTAGGNITASGTVHGSNI